MFRTAPSIACDELDKGFGLDGGGGVVSVLAGFEDFVFVEGAGGLVNGLFGAVVPAYVDPLFATNG